jgi:GNAT superfamily N-acetyltransferase
VIAAYRQYTELIPPDIFSAYLADLLDLDTHARYGRLLVVQADQWICAFGAWYPDASVQGVGLPAGWASGRALAVHPAARGNGAARTLVAAAERLTREAGAPVLAFHTVSFMTGAIALYERLGYCRVPAFDYDWAALHSRSAATPITVPNLPGPSAMAFAFLRDLTEDSAPPAIPTRRVSAPAYYLGRPAALWRAALTSRPAADTSARPSSASTTYYSSPDNE